MAYTKQGGSRTFTELLNDAGLSTPFEESCLRGVSEAAKAWLDSYDRRVSLMADREREKKKKRAISTTSRRT